MNKKTRYIDENISTFKKGLDLQREIFKNAKMENDYDKMCDAIENIEVEISHRLTKKDKQMRSRVLQIVNWYRTLESKYIKNTPEGKKVVYPPNIHNLVNKNLTVAFRLLVKKMASLELL